MKEDVARIGRTMAQPVKEGASTRKEANYVDLWPGGMKELRNLSLNWRKDQRMARS